MRSILHIQDDGGFSLLEAVLTMFILAIVLLGLSAMELTVDNELDESSMNTAAVLAAQQRMETLLATPYDLLVSGKEQWELLPGRNAVAVWEIRSDRPLPGMKTVDLRVGFVAGANREVSLVTAVRR